MNMIQKTEETLDKIGRAFLSPIIPRLSLSQKPGCKDYICCFCKQSPQDMYLFTRKQIYVCGGCSKVLDEIMDTNKRGGVI